MLIPGNVSIGSSTPDTSSVLSLTSTTQGFLPPRMTNTQRNAISSPTAGLVIYSSTDSDLEFWNGSAWIGATISGVISAQGTAPITVNGVSGSAQTGAITIAANNATTTTTGVASFPATYFSVAAGAVTPNNFTINTTAPLSGGGSITLGGSLTLSISGSGYVSSITGTANQISASASTGAVTLSFTNGISIGSYQATTPPTGGIICPGSVAFGAVGVGSNAGFLVAHTVTGVSGGFNEGTVIQPSLQPSSTSTYSSGLFISPSISATSNITNAIGCLVYAGTGGGGGGTITNGYGLYAFTPVYGTNKCAIYGDNAAIGYTGVTPPSSGLVIQGQVGIATSSPESSSIFNVSGTQTVVNATNQASVYLNQTLNPTSGSNLSSAFFVQPTFIAPSAQTITQSCGITVNPVYSSNIGTITNGFGVLIQGGTSATGTLTNNYSCYVSNPSAGSKKIALYTDNESIGYTATTPPSNGLIVSGIAGFSTSGPRTSTRVEIAGTNTVTDGTNTMGMFVDTIFAPSVSSTNASSVYLYPQMAPGTGVTITRGMGLFIDSGSTAGVGTTTEGYGIWCAGPGYGATNRYSAYFTAPSGATHNCAVYSDNLSIGYSATTPPSSGAIISGKTSIGTSSGVYQFYLSANSATDRFTSQFTGSQTGPGTNSSVGALIIDTTLNPNFNGTLNADVCTSVYIYPNINPQSGCTISQAAGILISGGGGGGAGTTTTGYGIVVGGPAYGATNRYSGYFNAPSGATHNCALYADNISIGYTATTPPTNGAIITGQVGIGTNSPNANAILDLTSTSKALLLPRIGTPGTGVSSPAAGMMAFNTTYNVPFHYDGTAWIGTAGFSLLSSLNFSSAASVSYNNSSTLALTDFNAWLLVFQNLLPVTNSVNFEVQFTTDGGSTYLTTGYTGGATTNDASSGATWTNTNSTSAVITPALGNSKPASYYLYVTNRNYTQPQMYGLVSQGGAFALVNCSQGTANFNGFKIFFSSGNISTVTVNIYGLIGI